jgi:hypothetical protein
MAVVLNLRRHKAPQKFNKFNDAFFFYEII